MGSDANLRRRLQRGPLLLDGALGTELERRGVLRNPGPLWSAAALLEAPAAVRAVHADYVAAGAELLVANTFRTNPRTLRRAGWSARGPALNRLAVELARAAAMEASRPVWVAASVAPVEDCYCPERVPDDATLREEHLEFANWLAAAAPDLLWIETIGTVREARCAAEAAVRVNLPFAISFILREDGELLGGESLSTAVDAVREFGPLACGLNCMPPGGLGPALARLRQLAPAVPLAAYAHINNTHPLRGWSYAESMEPGPYANACGQWITLGAQLVGGCCGTTPAHTAAVNRALRARK
jgi:S-methylmethionine-dependent homocysteine/selenocysteine methylase